MQKDAISRRNESKVEHAVDERHDVTCNQCDHMRGWMHCGHPVRRHALNRIVTKHGVIIKRTDRKMCYQHSFYQHRPSHSYFMLSDVFRAFEAWMRLMMLPLWTCIIVDKTYNPEGMRGIFRKGIL